MEPLEFLKSKIADFPGYGEDDSRRRSDELVRSYLGEAVAGLEERLGPLDAALGQRLGDLLLRVGFTNQAAYKIYEDAARTKSDYDAMAAADAFAVEVADRAPSEPAELPAFFNEVGEALDRRDATMSGAVAFAP
ncbi:MAG: hypothetical protein ABI231_07245 [Candidatus Tumulicola sp.]